MTTLEALFGARIATTVPGVVDAATAAAARARLARAGYTPYRLLDRGRYQQRLDPDEPALVAAATAVAAAHTGRTLVAAEARVLHLGPGDYLLTHHDRVHDDNPVEVVLDLSPAPVAGAEVHYRRRGQVYFRFAGGPGTAAVVERGPTVACNHTYVSQRHPDAALVRLIVLLRDPAPLTPA